MPLRTTKIKLTATEVQYLRAIMDYNRKAYKKLTETENSDHRDMQQIEIDDNLARAILRKLKNHGSSMA